MPPLNRVAAPNLKHPARIALAVPSQLLLIYLTLIVMLYQYHLVAVTHRVGTYAEGIVLDTKRWFISVAYQLNHLNRSHTLSLRLWLPAVYAAGSWQCWFCNTDF